MKTTCLLTFLLLIIFTINLSAQDCNNWLKLDKDSSFFRAGDIHVTGNQLTVEATFNRTAPWVGSDLYQGDLVSKHKNPTDCNYLLRPGTAEITTTSGYYRTPEICPIELNKTYHAAMVYDGKTLKFYRNGFLMSQVAASGDLILNTWPTQVGFYYLMLTLEQFVGYIDEVRIWNVARSQNEIKAYMSQSLPNPPSQVGLMAYYTFDDLLNKQGNPAWHGSLTGAVSINAANPQCNFVADSCNILSMPSVDICTGFQRAFGTPSFDRAIDVASTSNGEFFIAGVSNRGGNNDIVISKMNLDGSIIWSKIFGAGGAESLRKVKGTSDGGLLVIGQTGSFGNPNGDILAFKIDNSGGLIWTRKFGVGSLYGDLGMDIIETTEGGYVISGILNVNGGVADAVVIRLDNAANILWSKRFDNLDGEDGVGIVQKGDTLVVGVDLQNVLGNYEVAVMKLKLSDGAFIMSKKLVPTIRGLFNPYIYKNPSQPGYIISGHTIDGSSYADMKQTIIMIDDNLDLVFAKLISLNPVTNEVFTGLVPLSDGSFVGVASPQIGADGYIYKINGNNTVAFARRINNSSQRRLLRVAATGQEIIAVGGAEINGQEDFFVTVLNNSGLMGTDCDLEDISLSVEQPAYSTADFTWAAINDVSFFNTSVILNNSLTHFQETDLCPKPAIDFSFQQEICNSKNVQFTSSLPEVSSFQWQFGDGQMNNNSQTPMNLYENYGEFNVKLIVHYSGGCKDSIVKPVIVEAAFDKDLVFNSDTTICFGESIQLATGYHILNHCWKASGSPAPLTLDSYIKPEVTTTYTLVSQVVGANLVINGDFSSGNIGFTSDYNYAFPNITESEYWIGTNPSAWNGALSTCKDHTTASGNMMTVNGSPTKNARVWSQTVSVAPNTTYIFSAWIQSLISTNPASLQFSINDVNLGNNINASPTPCDWNIFSSSWNSGNNNSAVITIVNNNTIVSGNDFALDDIFFGTVTTKTDSFTVQVRSSCDSLRIQGPEKICVGTGAAVYSVNRSVQCSEPYSVILDDSFASIVSQTNDSLKLHFNRLGTSSIKVVFDNGCRIVEDSIIVTITNTPSGIDLGHDIKVCKDTAILLNAGTGFQSYLWQDGSTDSVYKATNSGVFSIKARDHCGVEFTDTFILIKSIPTPVQVIPATVSVCSGDSVQFTASGGTVFLWQPIEKFNDPESSSPRALINHSQVYSVRILDSVCLVDTTLNIPVQANNPAEIKISKPNDVNCQLDSTTLTASGGVLYNWTPNLYITRSNNNQITVKPPQTMTYYVEGTDAGGCSGKDSITVYFTKEGQQTVYFPNAFTPNNDGKNDFFRPSFTGQAARFDFRIFNRWGQLIFHTNTPGKGWDGRFRSVLQPGDVYVYYLTAEGSCNGEFVKKGTFVLIR